ncbi:hypothetical protein [Nostoc sp. 'Peltigera membranacea cyanobiont' 210A]|uniref:hypothetical protein n=1 Tax=Nostoc sp. 'Peltigera membranacea cyanobiont' 210A TaxID=2014529 RepID=UPI00117E14D7|nr:hypothetical protein [Nostoc sp. 'Peltigera membranacea cyanobiont' 210A]
MNRRLYKKLIIVETAIYRVFVMIYRIFSDLEFSSKNLNRTVLGLCDRLERVFSCQRRYRKLVFPVGIQASKSVVDIANGVVSPQIKNIFIFIRLSS